MTLHGFGRCIAHDMVSECLLFATLLAQAMFDMAQLHKIIGLQMPFYYRPTKCPKGIVGSMCVKACE